MSLAFTQPAWSIRGRGLFEERELFKKIRYLEYSWDLSKIFPPHEVSIDWFFRVSKTVSTCLLVHCISMCTCVIFINDKT